MFKRMQLKKEWKLSRNIIRDYYGRETRSREVIVKITDGEDNCDVILGDKDFVFLVGFGGFYGLANKSILESVHVIPDELLEFETCSCFNSNDKIRVTIKKSDFDSYSIEIYSKEYCSSKLYSPEINIKETLSKEILNEKLKQIPNIFEVYPFLILPLGNCFDCYES